MPSKRTMVIATAGKSCDFAPYSFFFREVCAGRNGICGGLIFHNYHDNLKKANYSVHT